MNAVSAADHYAPQVFPQTERLAWLIGFPTDKQLSNVLKHSNNTALHIRVAKYDVGMSPIAFFTKRFPDDNLYDFEFYIDGTLLLPEVHETAQLRNGNILLIARKYGLQNTEDDTLQTVAENGL